MGINFESDSEERSRFRERVSKEEAAAEPHRPPPSLETRPQERGRSSG